MRLETAEGKKYYCGRLKRAPAYTNEYDASSTVVIIDGKEVDLWVNRRTYYSSKITVFAFEGEWYYISDEDLKIKVFSHKIRGTTFITAGAKSKRNVSNRAKNFHALFAGQTRELIGDSKIAAKETRDCTVKALMEATGVPYDAAHRRMRPYRTNRQGCHFAQVLENFKDFERKPLPKKITLGTFVKDAIGGRYIVTVRGHALAVINGKIHDHSIKPGRKVMAVFKFVGKIK